MSRANSILILALSGVVVALVYGIASDRSSRIVVEPRGREAIEAQQTSSMGADRNEATPVASARSSGTNQKHTSAARGLLIRTDLTDENTHRDRMREEAAREVAKLYSLLLEDLNVSPKQRNDLISLLIESRVAATTKLQIDDWTPKAGTIVVRGKPMSVEERSQSIAAIIGDTKRQKFLALERNLPAYSEVQALASVLQTNGVPLTDTQRDRLLEHVVLTREQYLETSPKAVESIEDLERKIAAQDEYERHVLELAPSVLLSKQVPFIADQYQYWSELRMRDLEVQKKRVEKWRAERPNEKPILLIPDL